MAGPFIMRLGERKTILLRQPLVKILGLNPGKLPAGITKAQAAEVMAATDWAINAGYGVADKLGLTGAAREKAAKAWTWALAQGMVEKMA